MMQVIKCKNRVDYEGKITFHLPQDLENQELDVAIVYALAKSENIKNLDEVVDSFYGCLAEAPILAEENHQQKVA
ncbi:hypothetical protein [[Phormidium] sp. ETS-05]|uniref:hypothetical protein n=1 Tax=[Phormidium] sp. ETS-05 TaxID=222819 RepID=UPI0018EEEDEC|nr:hypothetical protein [[Phormidium] sp. ETS-05]